MPIRRKKEGVLLISKAERTDLKEILDLQYLAYQSEAILLNNQDIPPLKQTREDIEFEFSSSVFLKATDEQGNIMGSIRGHIVDGSLLIGKLIVTPAMQRQGIGTKLLEEIEKICPCKRCELFTSSKSIRNISLYEKNGYSIFKEEKLTEDICFIYLQKIKTPSP